jgi:hypothetical protein
VLLSRNVAHEDFRDYLVGSHQAILDALRDRDEAQAVMILEDHLRGSYERVVLSHGAADCSSWGCDYSGGQDPGHGGVRWLTSSTSQDAWRSSRRRERYRPGLALGMARQGADVAICDLDKEGLQSCLAEITELGRRGVAVRCDVEQPDQIAHFFAEIDANLGEIDVLVNNVGHVARSKPEDLSLDRWNWVLTTGVTASFSARKRPGAA